MQKKRDLGETTVHREHLKARDQRSGAVEARRAHNPDVPGSKPGCANVLMRVSFADLHYF